MLWGHPPPTELGCWSPGSLGPSAAIWCPLRTHQPSLCDKWHLGDHILTSERLDQLLVAVYDPGHLFLPCLQKPPWWLQGSHPAPVPPHQGKLWFVYDFSLGVRPFPLSALSVVISGSLALADPAA